MAGPAVAGTTGDGWGPVATATVCTDTAAALPGDTSWRAGGGSAWARVCSGCGWAGWGLAGAALVDAAAATSDAGASVAWRPAGVSEGIEARTGSVSTVLAEAVDAPEVGTMEADRGDAVTVPETVTASGAAAACMDEPVRAAWARRRREMRLGVGSSKTPLLAWGAR